MDNCIWEHKNNEWQTQCGHFISDEDTSIHWNFCPFCGKAIIDRQYETPGEANK